jgi:hypothetical protein
MALIACKECNHEISEQAAHCPHCGAPTSSAPRGGRGPRRVLYGLLFAFIVAWAGVTALWLTGKISSPSQLGELFRGRDRTVSSQSAQPSEPVVVKTRSVYQTSAEQLYQDYSTNAVAIQSKIGDSSIRVAGIVTDINQDAVGHPIVTLSAGSDAKAEMILNEDQRAAVAQLGRGDEVQIQCDRMQRTDSMPHGAACALALVGAGSRQVYLAVFLSNSTGNAPAYIVGPMPQGTCLSRADSIAAQLNANPRTDHIASRNCAATTRESIALEGCHLSTTMPAIPDVPTAHLWKYDCLAPSRATTHKPPQPEPQAPSPPPPAAPPPAAPIVEAPPAQAAPPSPPPPPDDLMSVRATDPAAADHIASYCNTATASATDRASVAAGCRRAEAGAWTRLMLDNEFPTLDDAARRRCNEPPFPDSYVAKESCAKYQLNIN